jgi:hypothetical protein
MESVSHRNEHSSARAAVLLDKFHVMRHLGKALDRMRMSEYARPCGKHQPFIEMQKYTSPTNCGNLAPVGKRTPKLLLSANHRAYSAYLLMGLFDALCG